MHTLWVAFFAVLMLPAFLGIFIPILPGVPLMLLISGIFGFIDRFEHLAGSELAWLGLVAGLSLLVDYLSGVVGAKYFGASAKAIGYGFIGMIVGLVLLPPYGGIIGLYLGIFLTELRRTDQRTAMRSATGGVIGSLAGMLLNLILGILFIALFVVFALK